MVDQRLDAISKATWQRLEESGHLGHWGLEGASQTGQEDLARGQIGELCQLSGGKNRTVKHSTLDDESLIGLRKFTKGLGNGTHVVVDERDGGRAGHEFVHRLIRGSRGRTAHQGVLKDLVVRTSGLEFVAQLLELGNGESAVFGDDGRRCTLKALFDLSDHGDLLGPRVIHRSSTVFGIEPHPHRARRTRSVPVGHLVRRI